MSEQNQTGDVENKIPDDWESIEEIRVVHPNYGFLTNNSDFTNQCTSADSKFPSSSDLIEKLNMNNEASSSRTGCTFNPLDGRPIRLLRRPESSSKLKDKDTEDLQKMTKVLTLEEREAAYQEARKRIFGTTHTEEEIPVMVNETVNYVPLDEGLNQINNFNPDTTLWMGDLKPSWNAEFIKNTFRHFSYETRNVKMLTDRFGTKNSYCFVEFSDPELARSIMFALCGKPIPNDEEGAKFTLSFANSPNQNPEFNLFVSNLSPNVDDFLLFRTFGERYNSCRGAKVYRTPDGISREFGLVRFTSETDQQKAMAEMNKHRLNNKEIFVKLAQPKDRHRVYVPRSYYNDRDRMAGGRNSARYSNNGNNMPYLPHSTNVIPLMNNGLPIGSIEPPQHPTTHQPYLGSNHGVAGYGMAQSAVAMQMPYGAPPPFFMMQYPTLVPQNANNQQRNGNIDGSRWQ